MLSLLGTVEVPGPVGQTPDGLEIVLIFRGRPDLAEDLLADEGVLAVLDFVVLDFRPTMA